MKWLVVFITLIVLTAYCANNNKAFKKLYALEGIWKMTTKRGVICEEWKKINDDYLQSKGYMIKDNDTIVNERVALTNKKNGIFYTSTVENQNNKQPVDFKMTSSLNNSFIFENPGHDFPKRIVYELVTADSLHAYIDDGTAESKKRQHFYYKRF